MQAKDMTVEQFRSLPMRKWDEITPCDSVVIIPAKDGCELHDSGYRRMAFALVKDGEPFCQVHGGSDVLHIGGIGGDALHHLIHPNEPSISGAWTVDCLPVSGLLQLWNMNGGVVAGMGLSSFEVRAVLVPHKTPKTEDESESSVEVKEV